MKSTRYDMVFDGEWHPLKKKNQREQCCDCYLTHRAEYRVVKQGSRLDIWFRVWRDNVATNRARKRHGVILKSVS